MTDEQFEAQLAGVRKVYETFPELEPAEDKAADYLLACLQTYNMLWQMAGVDTIRDEEKARADAAAKGNNPILTMRPGGA